MKGRVVALLVASCAAVAARAIPETAHPQATRPHPSKVTGSPQSRQRASINLAAAQAQKLNGGGRVLSVRETNTGYHVKLIKQGEVRIVVVPRN